MPLPKLPVDIDAWLFDLDGTLVDTAPDLAAALNRVRAQHGLAAMPLDALRPMASHGARGLLQVGMDVTPEDPRFESLKAAFLNFYEQDIDRQSRLFDGVAELIDHLQRRRLPWGIVTNKHSRFTDQLVPRLPWPALPQCVISGDTAAHPKPAPDPLLLAAQRLGVPAERCAYVGDDLRDMQSARAARMAAIAASYGYCGRTDPLHWPADAVIGHPLEICDLLSTSPA